MCFRGARVQTFEIERICGRHRRNLPLGSFEVLGFGEPLADEGLTSNRRRRLFRSVFVSFLIFENDDGKPLLLFCSE